jgi:hypothetical protein
MANKKIIFFSILLFLAFFAFAKNAKALDISVSQSDFEGVNSESIVQTAINSVDAAGGGTVYLPAGTSGEWTSTLSIQGGVNLIGYGNPMAIRETITSYGLNLPQGQWTPAPATIIRMGLGATYGIITNYPTITTGAVRIANIKFVQGSSIPSRYIEVYSNTQGFRIDHCEFQGSNRAIYIYPAAGTLGSYGVVDHCNFIEQWDYTFNIEGRFGTWVDNVPLGMDNDKAVYIEDNFFTKQAYNSGHPVGSFGGAIWVFRYNTVFQYPGYGQGGLDCHGPSYGWTSGGPGSPRGGGPYEIYNNYFIYDPNYLDGNMSWTSAGLRAMYGVIHHNYFYNLRYAILFETDADSCPGADTTRNCGPPGSSPGYIGAHPPYSGIPCYEDIPGWSGVYGTGYAGHVYIWGNTHTNVTGDGVNVYYYTDGSCWTDYSQFGTDILGYQNNWNGSAGNTGVARPGYTPYTYPHPLTLEGVPAPDTTPPAAPSGVTVN